MNLVIARSKATKQSSDMAFALGWQKNRGAGLHRCARNDEVHGKERSDEANASSAERIRRLFLALIPRPESQEGSLDCFAALAMTRFKGPSVHPRHFRFTLG